MSYNHEDAIFYLQILVLLYADDTVIVADSKEKLQKCLDDFYDYCVYWKLNINASKTEVIVLLELEI